MKKVEKYTGEKTYMFPNGALATREAVLEQFPAVLTFAHIVETDEAGEVAFAVENLSAMRTFLNIDPTLSEEDAIAAMQDILNAPEPVPEPSAEQRIAAALELQNQMIIESETEGAQLREEIQAAEAQLTDMQLALCEVYEIMVGGAV